MEHAPSVRVVDIDSSNLLVQDQRGCDEVAIITPMDKNRQWALIKEN